VEFPHPIFGFTTNQTKDQTWRTPKTNIVSTRLSDGASRIRHERGHEIGTGELPERRGLRTVQEPFGLRERIRAQDAQHVVRTGHIRHPADPERRLPRARPRSIGERSLRAWRTGGLHGVKLIVSDVWILVSI
jgi:hypothetical protein